MCGTHQRPLYPFREARPASLPIAVKSHPASIEVEQHEIHSLVVLMAMSDFETRLRPVIAAVRDEPAAQDVSTICEFLSKQQQCGVLGKGVRIDWLGTKNLVNDGTKPMGIIHARAWLHHRGNGKLDPCVVEVMDRVCQKVKENGARCRTHCVRGWR